MRNFRKLNIWNDGILLVKDIYQISATLPNVEKFGLRSQLCRAAVSVPANIAEGCSRSSDQEYVRFLQISMGSLFEVETILIIVQKLDLDHEGKTKLILAKIEKLQKMINKLCLTIKATSVEKQTAKGQ